ncbi:MAG: hypothetical protein EOO88_47980 [Pedobacter sp.]|nr:MAG: hypothetical protein EOO88_47980 [Pedobacter sp.]
MIVRSLLQVAGFALVYTLVLGATFPFLIYFGKAKPWQKIAEFFMSFPIDNEKVGVFSLPGVVALFFLNGLLWGACLLGLFRSINQLLSLLKNG